MIYPGVESAKKRTMRVAVVRTGGRDLVERVTTENDATSSAMGDYP